MRSISSDFLILTSSAIAAGPPVVPNPQVQFDNAVVTADRITILHAVSPTFRRTEERLIEVVTGTKQSARIAGMFKFSGEYAIAYEEMKDGEKTFMIMNCLCDGDYVLNFAKGDTELLSLSIHHWAHVRSTGVVRGRDLKITEASATALREYLEQRVSANTGKKPTQKRESKRAETDLAFEPQVGPPPKLSASERKAFEQLLHDVARAKNWSPEEYSTELVGGYSGIVVFRLAHREDLTVGVGKSVELHIDRAKKRIVHELGYQ